jgi:hypothetical protein
MWGVLSRCLPTLLLASYFQLADINASCHAASAGSSSSDTAADTAKCAYQRLGAIKGGVSTDCRLPTAAACDGVNGEGVSGVCRGGCSNVRAAGCQPQEACSDWWYGVVQAHAVVVRGWTTWMTTENACNNHTPSATAADSARMTCLLLQWHIPALVAGHVLGAAAGGDWLGPL